jgi:NAD(P)-dependent dehydrogenase (short-subunit alcohol dehydrogenase family)
MENLNNKIAVITGGNSGIGYAAAKEMKAQGAKVIITGRRQEALDKAAAELGVTGFVADQSDVAQITALADQVKDQYGEIDILFINAGITSSAPIAEATEAHFDSIFNINFRGAYFTLSKFISLLKDGASVVFLSSNTASMNGANLSVYSAGKAALNAVMSIAAVELAPRRIRVNSVSPGPTQTEILNKLGLDEAARRGLDDWMIERIR